MAPTAVVSPSSNAQDYEKILAAKANAANGTLKNGNGVSYAEKAFEDYEGNYQFAPIEEAEVSRAMIKRSVKESISTIDLFLNE